MLYLSANCLCISSFFVFNHTAATETYTLSLHDALPIFLARDAETQLLSAGTQRMRVHQIIALPMHLHAIAVEACHPGRCIPRDRKSTRLNSSHSQISYAVFCLKKKTSSSRQPR